MKRGEATVGQRIRSAASRGIGCTRIQVLATFSRLVPDLLDWLFSKCRMGEAVGRGERFVARFEHQLKRRTLGERQLLPRHLLFDAGDRRFIRFGFSTSSLLRLFAMQD